MGLPFAQMLIQLLLRFLTCVAVFLLELPYELFTCSVQDIQFVFGEFAPCFSYLAFELFPVPFDLIPVHYPSLSRAALIRTGFPVSRISDTAHQKERQHNDKYQTQDTAGATSPATTVSPGR